MNVRYSSIAIPDFNGLFSTFVKIDLAGDSAGSTVLTQSYEGMSLSTTTRLSEAFLRQHSSGEVEMNNELRPQLPVRRPPMLPPQELWEEIWAFLSQVEARKIVLFTLLFSALFGTVNWLLLQDSVPNCVMQSLGFALGFLIGSWLVAVILAVPGWLIRGSYNIKPMFVGHDDLEFSLGGGNELASAPQF